MSQAKIHLGPLGTHHSPLSKLTSAERRFDIFLSLSLLHLNSSSWRHETPRLRTAEQLYFIYGFISPYSFLKIGEIRGRSFAFATAIWISHLWDLVAATHLWRIISRDPKRSIHGGSSQERQKRIFDVKINGQKSLGSQIFLILQDQGSMWKVLLKKFFLGSPILYVCFTDHASVEGNLWVSSFSIWLNLLSRRQESSDRCNWTTYRKISTTDFSLVLAITALREAMVRAAHLGKRDFCGKLYDLTRLWKFQQLLKTQVILILNFTRTYCDYLLMK